MTSGASAETGSGQSTLLRQLMLLQWIPRAPDWISAPEIRQRLDGQGYRPSLRTVQRDLDRLATRLPLVCDRSGRPYGWMWAQDAPEVSVPALDPVSALGYAVLEEYAWPRLPAGLLERVQPRLRQARQLLAAPGPGGRPGLAERVRVIGPEPPQRPPAVDGRVLQTVSRALLRDCRIRARYRARDGERARAMELHPRALVIRGNIPHLVASLDGDDSPRTLVLARFLTVELDPRSCRPSPAFDLDGFLDGDGQSRPRDRRLHLVARIDAGLAARLEVAPLGEDQRMDAGPGGRLRLRVQVTDSPELRSWILAQGADLVVERPAGLRADIATMLRQAADGYA